MRRHALFIAAVLALTVVPLAANEVIPPKPTSYFTDAAGVVSPAVADRINSLLENHERQTSEQILVVIYPKMASDSSIDDYAVRVAQAWGVGQKETNNGAVLFIFMQNHTANLQVGYGLEGALPDALAKQIIDSQLTPHFRQGDYDGGVSAAVDAILAATRGEYKGTGRTVHDRRQSIDNFAFFAVLFLIVLLLQYFSRRSRVYGGGGWFYSSGPSSWGGGGFGGGGGFSSGGGSFGGGGASGSW